MRVEWEIDRWISAASTVMQVLCGSVVVNSWLSTQVKLAIYWQIYIPILTYSHKLWVVTEKSN